MPTTTARSSIWFTRPKYHIPHRNYGVCLDQDLDALARQRPQALVHVAACGLLADAHRLPPGAGGEIGPEAVRHGSALLGRQLAHEPPELAVVHGLLGRGALRWLAHRDVAGPAVGID